MLMKEKEGLITVISVVVCDSKVKLIGPNSTLALHRPPAHCHSVCAFFVECPQHCHSKAAELKTEWVIKPSSSEFVSMQAYKPHSS